MRHILSPSGSTLLAAAAITTFVTLNPAHAASKAVAVMHGAQDTVAASLIDEMTDRQFTLTGQTADSLQFDRPIDNVALYPSLGGKVGALPRARVTMTLAPAGQDTRVAAKMVIVKNPGPSEEVVADLSDLGADPGLDRMLTRAQDTLVAQAKRDPLNVAFADSNR